MNRSYILGLSRAAVLAVALTAVAGLCAGITVYSHVQTAKTGEGATKGPTVPIPGGTYRIDAAHSSVGFSVRHLVINNVRGRFTDFSGTIQYNDQDVSKSSVEFTAKVASINTDIARRDEHLKAPDFFDAARYPELSFKSSRIEKRGSSEYVAHGDFTMRGVTKQIAIPFKLFGAIIQGGNARIGIEGSTVINRQDYGITYGRALEGGGLVVGNDVTVELFLEAVRPDPSKAAPTDR